MKADEQFFLSEEEKLAIEAYNERTNKLGYEIAGVIEGALFGDILGAFGKVIYNLAKTDAEGDAEKAVKVGIGMCSHIEGLVVSTLKKEVK